MLADAGEDSPDEGAINVLFSYLEDDSDGRNHGEVAGLNIKVEQETSGLRNDNQGLARGGNLSRQQKRASEMLTEMGSGSGNRSRRQRDADKVKELEAVAAAKMEQFADLLQRNRELQFKSKILSDAVMLRDDQLRIIKDWSKCPAPWPMTSPPETITIGTAAAGQTDPALMQLQLMASTAQAVQAPGSVRLLLAPETLTPAQHAEVRAIGRQQMAASWKAFVSEMSVQLLSLEFNPADEAAAGRMKQAAAKINSLCRRVAVLAPTTMVAMAQTHLETDELGSPDPGFWTQVLQTLKLTDEQLREIRAVYELFSGIMRRILAERRAIQAQLSTGLEAVDQRPLVAPRKVPPEAEVLPALERNMRKEGAAHLLVLAFLYGHTFSIMQMCRAAVHSYPYYPSATGLAAAAAGVSV